MHRTILPFTALFLVLAAAAYADLRLDGIQFDPAIIASGDRVDIVVQFHDSGYAATENRLGNPDYQYQVTLIPDDTLTEQYVTIEDAVGDDTLSIIERGGSYSKRFRVKVNDNAPPGEYEFKLSGQWYFQGKPTSDVQFLRFRMTVKKEGAALSIANVISTPQQVRSGDKEILLTTSVTNTGEKLAKNVRIKLTYPEGISSAYTNNNELTLGTLDARETAPVQLHVDTEKNIPAKLYAVGYLLTYEDTEGNGYTTHGTFPFVVKKKPTIEVIEANGSGNAGGPITLRVTVKNTGEETADAVDVRLLKQSSQPFEIDVRSEYLGRLEPGQTATALFTLAAHRDAEVRAHTFSLVLRATGDSNEGDDNIYTWSDAATLEITGKQPNLYPLYAVIALAVIVIVLVVRHSLGNKRR